MAMTRKDYEVLAQYISDMYSKYHTRIGMGAEALLLEVLQSYPNFNTAKFIKRVSEINKARGI